MSSPIAKDHKKGLDQAMINFHQKVSHNTRTHILTQLFIQEIQSINTENSPITLLDVGCGDMTISNAISHEYNVVQNTGIDLYPNKENWENYKQFDGVSFPFDDKSFDIILFSDMLHHDNKNIDTILFEAKRVAHHVIIKDHFEFGWISRKLLQLADIVGNYGYGVSIPERYFSTSLFESTISKNGLKETNRITPIFLYNHLPMVKYIFKGKYQFISTLKC